LGGLLPHPLKRGSPTLAPRNKEFLVGKVGGAKKGDDGTIHERETYVVMPQCSDLEKKAWVGKRVRIGGTIYYYNKRKAKKERKGRLLGVLGGAIVKGVMYAS